MPCPPRQVHVALVPDARRQPARPRRHVWRLPRRHRRRVRPQAGPAGGDVRAERGSHRPTVGNEPTTAGAALEVGGGAPRAPGRRVAQAVDHDARVRHCQLRGPGSRGRRERTHLPPQRRGRIHCVYFERVRQGRRDSAQPRAPPQGVLHGPRVSAQRVL
jgi:hypothetical protein